MSLKKLLDLLTSKKTILTLPGDFRDILFEEIARTGKKICLISNSPFKFRGDNYFLDRILVTKKPRSLGDFNRSFKRAIFLKGVEMFVLDIYFEEKDYLNFQRQLARMEYYLSKSPIPLLLNIPVEGPLLNSCSGFSCLEQVNFKQNRDILQFIVGNFKFINL